MVANVGVEFYVTMVPQEDGSFKVSCTSQNSDVVLESVTRSPTRVIHKFIADNKLYGKRGRNPLKKFHA